MPGPEHDPIEGVDAEGMIRTGADRAHIPPAFVPLLDRAVESLRSYDGEPSLYVYGSVATGTAREGDSDVDLVTVDVDASFAREMGERLSEEFAPLSRGVDVGPGQPSSYEGSSDRAYGNRVFLRHYCVHLFGPDLALGLPRFPADRAAARGFNGDIGLHADRWREALRSGKDPVLLGRRIARKTLFAVCGLVSIHDDTWTTDRWKAARRWAEVTPRLARPLDTLGSWATRTSPGCSASDVRLVLEGVVAEVVRDFAEQIGLWDAGLGDT